MNARTAHEAKVLAWIDRGVAVSSWETVWPWGDKAPALSCNWPERDRARVHLGLCTPRIPVRLYLFCKERGFRRRVTASLESRPS